MEIIKQIKEKAKKIKDDLIIIYFAYKNPKLKIIPKIFIFFILAYLLSPIDIIPDFIPVIGYLDEFIIIPLLILISLKLIPEEIIKEAKAKALVETPKLKKNWFLVILLLITFLIIITSFLIKIFKN